MDKSIILDLVFDGRCYGDKITLYDNKVYCENQDKLHNILEELCKDLTEEEKKKTLNDIIDAMCAMECVSSDKFFKEGFKLGLILSAQNFLD